MSAPDAGTVRVRLDIAYDGTDFHGWAAQDGLRTVAGVLEDRLATVVRRPVRLVVAGRTDAGVHAHGQVAHVDLPADAFTQRSLTEPADLVRRLSRMLPPDIRLHGASAAPEGFDARFSALRRHYLYRVSCAPAGVLPVRARDTAAWRRPVDRGAMQAAADALVGLHDFAAFCRAREGATTVRDLQEFTWTDVSTDVEPETYEARVTADAFCWSMVRSLVGACLAVGEGRRAAGFTGELLGERRRSPRVPVAPANGLALTGVDYPADELLAARAEETRATRGPVDGEGEGGPAGRA
ncbi:tRNA pseudouridine(38-40) synthase TruA [Corynebacterium bovis]|uniref:tRNA pseudouridine synthase A n=1 Tax=Corynebacterium bovis TaxID=36808 RepID=A0A426Q4Z9_9CORY|nr:tRNA pseudouridine(38-40) synthase TruA [Corynebacterium bovis]RRO91738.1 tRNA pseudouridine(38-40) synthase TruA [Corynebacterium bovis]RRO97700.1 tRNA pseudouridine(38-40) synthase TruA [Corynebacterium bovis]RRQ00644.1 tRNA pseudouridine(38-40) synthase TruA [Corynebacterium bovis]RRQ04155.1 tRNA pseudouridine(38-40) synthase TruA [Corynebacterium bovis]RRQ04342.1 tRNA pseudouridine(38-40) synthase TruA [Corynebacterium bovis]